MNRRELSVRSRSFEPPYVHVVAAVRSHPLPTHNWPLLLDVDLTDERTAMLGLARDRLRIPFALSMESGTRLTMYFEIDEEGNAVPDDEPDPDFARDAAKLKGPLVLGRERSTPYETAHRAGLGPKSQFGGCPSWQQMPHFPECQSCACRMPCIAQIDLGAVGLRGLVHVYLCAGCETAAAAYECD